MTTGPGRPKQSLSVRVDPATRQALEAMAAAEGKTLPDYLRDHYHELVSKGTIIPEEEIRIQNPGPAPNQPYGYGGYGGYQMQPHYPPPYPYATVPAGPDQMDIMFAEMRKIWMTKLLAEMIEGKRNIEDIYLQMQAGKNGGTRKDTSLEDIMKYQMIMNQQDRQYQNQLNAANLQLEQARNKGDKKGENDALQLITALATTQAQQSQNNMQQIVAMMQMANNTQATMYNTSLNAANQAQERQSQERREFQQQMANIQNNLTNTQLESIKSTSSLQLGFLQQELERIRNDPKKDPISQLIELDKLRHESPILDAAFKGAFGIKEGGLSDLIPKLKEIGIGPLIDKVGQILPTLATGLMGGGKRAPPPPPPGTSVPGPMPEPTAEQLQQLANTSLEEEEGEEIQVEQQEVPDTVGYTNLSIMQTPPKQAQTNPSQPTRPATPTKSTPQQNPETVGYTNLVSMPPPSKKAVPPPKTEPAVTPASPEEEVNVQPHSKKT